MADSVEAGAGSGDRRTSVSTSMREGGDLVGRDDPEAVTDFYHGAPRRWVFLSARPECGEGAGTVVATVVRAADGAPAPVRYPLPGRNYAVMRVFFATDRQPVSAGTGAFGTELSASCTTGTATSAFRESTGSASSKGPSIFRLEFRNDPEKHIVVLRVTSEHVGEFNRALSDRLASSLRHEALLFVHGFNVTFEDAIRRAAQISYDLAFDGPTVVFSWPSQGGMLPLDYRRDERNAELSADNLRR